MARDLHTEPYVLTEYFHILKFDLSLPGIIMEYFSLTL